MVRADVWDRKRCYLLLTFVSFVCGDMAAEKPLPHQEADNTTDGTCAPHHHLKGILLHPILLTTPTVTKATVVMSVVMVTGRQGEEAGCHSADVGIQGECLCRFGLELSILEGYCLVETLTGLSHL